jgi:hypothetical protein
MIAGRLTGLRPGEKEKVGSEVGTVVRKTRPNQLAGGKMLEEEEPGQDDLATGRSRMLQPQF